MWSAQSRAMEKKRRKLEKEESRKRQLEEKYGVLVPPSFVMTTSSDPTAMPVSAFAALKAADSPSLLHYLSATNAGSRLLSDHVKPGIWLSFGLSGGTNATATSTSTATSPSGSRGPSRNVLVSLDASDPASDGEHGPSAMPSMVWAGQTSSDGLASMELRVPTRGPPAVRGSYRWNSASVTSQLQANGRGWIGAQWNKTHQISTENELKEDINYILGGWLDIDVAKAAKAVTETNPFKIFTKTNDDIFPSWARLSSPFIKKSHSVLPCLHAYGAAEWLQTMLAVEARMPVGDTSSSVGAVSPLISTMFSLDIASYGNDPKDVPDRSKPNQTSTSSVPLWLTLHSHNEWIPDGVWRAQSAKPQWALNLSQILTFDRTVVNPVEDRASSIRQTLGWVVQVESKKNSATKGKSTSTSKERPAKPTTSPAADTVLSLGATWQINRGAAVKAVVKDFNLTYGLILRRWAQPRVTLSLLQSCDLRNPLAHNFAGLGIEIDTSTDDTDDLLVRAEYNDKKTKPLDRRVPETKIHLPPHVNQSTRSDDRNW